MHKHSKRLSLALAIGLGVFATISLLHQQGLLDRLEGMSYDLRMSHSRGDIRAPEEIAVVLIDDASIKSLEPIAGRWPWPRSLYSELLDFLALGEPHAVLFDVTFHERDRNDSTNLGEEDAELVASTAQYSFVHHAIRLVHDTPDESNTDLLDRPLPKNFVARNSVNGRLAAKPLLPSPLVALDSASNNNAYLPFSQLLEVTPATGVVDVNADNDGVYRRARLFHRYDKHYFPSLSSSALLTPENGDLAVSESGLLWNGRKVPLDTRHHALVNYYAHFDTYSFGGMIASKWQIDEGQLENLVVDPFEFKDKIVFIGASAAGLEDLKTTPLDSRLPGVLIHASLSGNLIENDFLQPPQKFETLFFSFLFAIFISFGVLFSRSLLLQAAIPTLTLSLFVSWNYWQFQTNVVYELMAPSMSILGSWLLTFSALLMTEGRDKRRFKRMMSRYLSPAVLNSIGADPDAFAQARVGAREELTILFSDIRSFTSISEKLPPERVVEMLNHYFSAMTQAIFNHQGTIDKFIGDAIMAFWGAPLRTDQHAKKAILAALEMKQKLVEVNRWLEENQLPPVKIGIGLHTGEAILGNIGSDYKLDYTIIGDNVNLASRMEGLTKQYGCEILLTEDTYKRISDSICCAVIDRVRVKGKHEPILIYQPLNQASREEAQRIAAIAAEAFDLYSRRQWQDAIARYALLPSDSSMTLMANRCRHFQQHPPADDWDGVFILSEK